MKSFISLVAVSLLTAVTGCGPKADQAGDTTDQNAPERVVEATVADAGCGMCLFDLSSDSGCSLAVRIDGKAYPVEGFTMQQFGDPHAAGGMCETTHKMTVAGRITDGKFVATQFVAAPAAQ